MDSLPIFPGGEAGAGNLGGSGAVLPPGTGSGGTSNAPPPVSAGGSSSEIPGNNIDGFSGASGSTNGPNPNNTGGTTGNNEGGASGSGQEPDPNEPPPEPAGDGRAGAELCPDGPFGAPLPASPQVNKLFSVGENNFFNFEGPVWVGNALYFSEIGGGNAPPPSRINRFIPAGTLERGVLQNTGSNGLGVDADGNLIAATHDLGAISTFALPGGARGQLGAQTFNGNRFNSPNDVVERSDGNVYFTDPAFQAPGNPQGATRVYRLAPDGTASVVDASLSNPNGITLSPDGNTLYVTAANGFFRYALDAAGAPGAQTSMGANEALQTPDGMAVDCAGNIYTTEHFRRLVRVFAPDGTELGRFGGPGSFDRDITNLAFGGPNRTTMFVTSLTQGQEGGVFSVELQVPGLPY